jgi:hypothetical protein
MIKIFRNIRQNLLMENKTSKYFKYAIGEIILVVIGILIALQINNWNSDRLNANRNYTLLVKLSKELDLNIERSTFLDTTSIGFTESGKHTDSILKILNRGIMVSDLDYLVENSTFYETNLNLNTSVFEELKNTGSLYAIGSDSLVTAIQRYYQLCDRESFYSLTYGKELINLKEKCYNGWLDFSYLYRIESTNAISDHSWIFNPRFPEYIHYRQFIDYYKFYSHLMTYKLNGIITESKKLQELITIELQNNK